MRTSFVSSLNQAERSIRWYQAIDNGEENGEEMDDIVKAFAAELRKRLGPRVKQIMLFGSRVRGESREGSDYDLLVVVDARTPEVRSIILDIEFGLMDRYGALVTTILRSEAEWQRSQPFPLARNILREGVAV